MVTEKENKKIKKISVIDALSSGYQGVGQHIWLILVPVLVDLWLWLGPHVSASDAVEALEKFFANTSVAFPSDYMEMVTKTLEQLKQVNLFSVLALSPMGPPSLLGGLGLTSPVISSATTWQLYGTGQLFIFVILMVVLGLLLAAAYMVPMAVLLRGDHFSWATLLYDLGRSWASFILFSLIMLVGIFVASMILSFVLLFASLFGSTMMTAIMGFFLMLSSWLMLWLLVTFAFVPESIVLDRAPVLTAMARSLNVVWRNFWATVLLVGLGLALTEGFYLIWERLGSSSLGLIIGIAGNAYISSGVALASMLFYRDRFSCWQQELAAQVEVASQKQTHDQTES